MQILDRLKDVKVLVIGDVMLDRYWWGDVSRISPEAPVPVVRLKDSTIAAGGAANVAANIAGLGATPILIGCVGDDTDADLFPDILRNLSISPDHLIKIAGRPTTVKTRVIAHSQQVARIDQETTLPLSEADENLMFETAMSFLDSVSAIAVSDYAKGMLTDRLLLRLIAEAGTQGKAVLVDPKGKNYAKYRGATLLTPNRREAAEACNLDDDGTFCVRSAGEKLMKDLAFTAVLITQGEEGMTLCREGREPLHMPALAREVYDVTGAGDTVLAALAAGVGAGADLESAANLANIAAGIVVEQVGTTAITADKLRTALEGS